MISVSYVLLVSRRLARTQTQQDELLQDKLMLSHLDSDGMFSHENGHGREH